MTFTMLEAAPESAGRTPASEAVVSGTNTMPRPPPSSSMGPITPVQYPVAGETRDSQAMPAIAGTIPAIIRVLGPTRPMSRGAPRDTPNSMAVIGRNAIPARSGLNPRTSCRNWVRKKNIPNIPATSSSRAT